MVREEGLEDRIRYREGDLREAAWGEGFDVLFLFNILHNLSGAECEAALGKARAALRAGGTLVVVGSEHGGGSGNLSAVAGFNELFFFLVSGSQAWPEATIRAWMEKAGFSGLKRRSGLMLPGLLILSGRA
jgi:hypothetical protein